MAHRLGTQAAVLTIAALFYGAPTVAADAEAAKALIKSNNCGKCHDASAQKDGPSWKKIAEKYRGDAQAEAKLTKHVTTAPVVKFPDGYEEDHKIIRTSPEDDPAQIKNLVQWVISN